MRDPADQQDQCAPSRFSFVAAVLALASHQHACAERSASPFSQRDLKGVVARLRHPSPSYLSRGHTLADVHQISRCFSIEEKGCWRRKFRLTCLQTGARPFRLDALEFLRLHAGAVMSPVDRGWEAV